MKERTIKIYRTEIIKNNIFNWNADWVIDGNENYENKTTQITVQSIRYMVGCWCQAIEFDSIQAWFTDCTNNGFIDDRSPWLWCEKH